MKNYLDYLGSTENFGFQINTNVFETNIINLIILLIILFVVIKNFLDDNLNERKKKIMEALDNAEVSLANSKKRYNEAKKQWSQIAIMIQELNTEIELVKQNVVKVKWKEAKDELSKKFSLAVGILRNREKKIFNEVIKEVSQKALARVIFKLKNQLSEVEQSQVIDRKLEQLGDQS